MEPYKSGDTLLLNSCHSLSTNGLLKIKGKLGIVYRSIMDITELDDRLPPKETNKLLKTRDLHE